MQMVEIKATGGTNVSFGYELEVLGNESKGGHFYI